MPNPPEHSGAGLLKHYGNAWPRNGPWWGALVQNADTTVTIPPGRVLTVNQGVVIGDRLRVQLGVRSLGGVSSTRNVIGVSLNTIGPRTTVTDVASFGRMACEGWVTNLMVTGLCSVMDPLRLSNTWPGIAVHTTRTGLSINSGNVFGIAAADRTVTDAPASPIRAFVGHHL